MYRMVAQSQSLPDMSATFNTVTSEMTETKEQRMQRTLGMRDRGGPREQVLSPPQRLRHTRGVEVLHSSLEEPLSHYKTLEPQVPRWPSTWRRYHLNHGIRVIDQDTVMVSARDKLCKTKMGLQRSSSGTVTYSHTHLTKVQLDVEVLGQICGEGIPGGGHAWTPAKMERIFRERTGRPGSWAHYEVPFKKFLELFPKTFELFGPEQCFVRLRKKGRNLVLDVTEDAIVRLARARQDGFVEQHPRVEGTIGYNHEDFQGLVSIMDRLGVPEEKRPKLSTKAPILPELSKHRLKAAYVAHDCLGSTSRPQTAASRAGTFPHDSA